MAGNRFRLISGPQTLNDGISWTMWEYDDSFGLVEQRGDRLKLDTAVAEALGFTVESAN